ncbi:MAG TPA: hypothetical protein VGQ77_16460 [Methylomirabilota bacterium]|nr:hypothetical protein [Methylomirabilota bacterium]
METLLLKLVLTPALIGGASLAARRWGHAISGWLVGLPLTSGPIAFFLALERGTSFAAAAAIGSLAGAVAEVAFCLTYAGVAVRVAWPIALAFASVAFAVVAAAFPQSALSVVIAGASACVSLTVALYLVPRGGVRSAMPSPPRWDLPARMIIATVLVLAITELAPVLGPRWSGVLATFPVYAAILTVFAHRTNVASAVEVLRGLLLGLFAFAAFFVVLAALIERAGIAAAFAAAIVTALAIQAVSFALGVRSAPQRS